MLRHEVLTHKKEYLSLVVGLLSFLILFLLVWPNTLLIRLSAFSMATFYVVWGILTHRYAPRKVFLEYVVIAVLGFSAILFLTF